MREFVAAETHAKLCEDLKSPQIFLGVTFQSNLYLDTGTQRTRPNDAELRLVLPILNDDEAAHLNLVMDRAQPNSAAADIESVDEFRIGFAGDIVAENFDRQDCPDRLHFVRCVHQ